MIELILPNGERRLLVDDEDPHGQHGVKLMTLRQAFNILRENGAGEIAIPEIVRIRYGDGQAVFVMDDDAIAHDLPPNAVASDLYSRSASWVMGATQRYTICGPIVLFTAPHRIGGDYDGHQPVARLPDHVLAKPGWSPAA